MTYDNIALTQDHYPGLVVLEIVLSQPKVHVISYVLDYNSFLIPRRFQMILHYCSQFRLDTSTGGAPTLDLCIHVREPPI